MSSSYASTHSTVRSSASPPDTTASDTDTRKSRPCFALYTGRFPPRHTAFVQAVSSRPDPESTRPRGARPGRYFSAHTTTNGSIFLNRSKFFSNRPRTTVTSTEPDASTIGVSPPPPTRPCAADTSVTSLPAMASTSSSAPSTSPGSWSLNPAGAAWPRSTAVASAGPAPLPSSLLGTSPPTTRVPSPTATDSPLPISTASPPESSSTSTAASTHVLARATASAATT